jgi:hypothetical protein
MHELASTHATHCAHCDVLTTLRNEIDALAAALLHFKETAKCNRVERIPRPRCRDLRRYEGTKVRERHEERINQGNCDLQRDGT